MRRLAPPLCPMVTAFLAANARLLASKASFYDITWIKFAEHTTLHDMQRKQEETASSTCQRSSFWHIQHIQHIQAADKKRGLEELERFKKLKKK